LVEIVVGAGTPPGAVDAARGVVARLGKDPIVVRDQPGFATSRLGVALGLEAIRMVEDGVASAADIDKAMMLGYRHPMGPLELTDVVGLDVRLDIARALHAAYGDRFAPPDLLVRLVADGWTPSPRSTPNCSAASRRCRCPPSRPWTGRRSAAAPSWRTRATCASVPTGRTSRSPRYGWGSSRAPVRRTGCPRWWARPSP